MVILGEFEQFVAPGYNFYDNEKTKAFMIH